MSFAITPSRVLIACLAGVLATARPARADDKVLVLRAEGRADKAVRTKVEGAVFKLAKTTSESTTAGDVTFGDAAMMVGCKPDDDKCKDEVLGMLAVDELIAITANPKAGGIEVAVRRIGKGGTTRNAAAVVTPDKVDQLDALASLFGKPGPAAPVAVTTAPRAPGREPAPVAPTPIAPTPLEPAEQPTTTATTTLPAPIDHTRDDDRPAGNRLPMIGMVGGGVLLVVGVVFWASASSIETEIRDAPKRTRADLEHVKDLEAQGDAYATTGNLLALGGLVLGGISTYYYVKSGKRSNHHTAVAPILGNGTGMVVTWGGSL